MDYSTYSNEEIAALDYTQDEHIIHAQQISEHHTVLILVKLDFLSQNMAFETNVNIFDCHVPFVQQRLEKQLYTGKDLHRAIRAALDYEAKRV